MSAAALTHAGGIVYRRRGSAIEILIVRARSKPHDWVLTKGHIEPGETPEMCARREIREEAGVDGEPHALLGVDRFINSRGPVVVALFLLTFVRNVPPEEMREIRWVTFDEAAQLVLFDRTRAFIVEARTRLESIAT
jgi:8-oxo-dGTP pyrophosphatase MutT (NUDIX family)